MSNRRPGDWWPCFSADETEADVLRLAAVKLGILPERIEVLKTGGGWLARKRRDDED